MHSILIPVELDGPGLHLHCVKGIFTPFSNL